MRRWLCIILTVYLLGQISFKARAQAHILHTQFYGIEQGLSHRDVQCVHQDRRGFIWLGTNYGLNRFDGYRFKWFTKEKNGLQSNMVNHIVEDGDGLMWLFNTTNRQFQTPLSIDIFNPETEEVTAFDQKFGPAAPFSVADVFSFAATADGRIVFSILSGQLAVYTPGKGFEVHALSVTPVILHSFSARNTIWGYAYDKETDIRTAIVELDFSGNILRRYDPGYPIQNTFIGGEDSSGNLWYILKRDGPKPPNFSAGELFRINDRGESEKIALKKNNAPVDSLDLDRVGYGGGFQLWLHPGNDALYLYSGNSFQVFHPEQDWYLELAPAHKFLTYTNSVYFDRKGNAWVGTNFGVYHIEIRPNPFRQILNDKNEENFRAFRGIVQDAAGHIWASNDRGDGWLWQIRNHGGQYSVHDLRAMNSPINRPLGFKYALYTDRKGFLWFGSGLSKMIVQYHPLTLECQFFPFDIPRKIESLQVNIWSFYEDDDGTIWFGTDAGSIGYIDERRQVVVLPELEGVNAAGGCVYQFLKDKSGKLWVATDKGLFLLDTRTKQAWAYRPPTGPLPWEGVLSMHEDADGSFWLGTKGLGLFHWQPETGVSEQFTKADGLSNNTIYAVYADDFQNLWLPSDYGIIRFNKNTRQTTAYLKKDGITHNEFNRISHFKAPDGILYFGSLNGITAFHPRDFQADSFDLNIPLVITGFQQFLGSENKLVDKKNALLKNQTITIAPDDRFFLLEFALLAYEEMENVQYAYRLEGEDADWTYQKENSIRFSRLPYGRHLLRIKGQLPDGHWSINELHLSVVVLKPFYLQGWFLALLVPGILAGIYGYAQLRVRSLKARQAELEKVVEARTRQISKDKQTIELQAEELKSLEKLKSRFFANVSHELRTPLTLMLGPVNSLLKRSERNDTDRALLQLIRRNARQLQKLINEILDLSKLEANMLEVNEEPVCFFPYLKEQLAQFHSFAANEKLDLEIDYRAGKSLTILLDKNKFEKIVHNFLSNALKFTPSGGRVTLAVDAQGDQLTLSVRDTGPGIHPDDLPFLFDRFYQSKQPEAKTEGGTGIGLSLCKELAQLLGGDVWAESELGNGSAFYFRFPRKVVGSGQSAVDSGQSAIDVPESDEPARGATYRTTKAQRQSTTILIVEDNPDLREYLRFVLSEYTVVTAENGQVALDCLLQTANCQLIISDLMMPVMDGFQLLEKLKSDDRWRHLPVIMLTAKVNVPSKLQALRIGVDDYLTKPFEEEELKTRIENLLRNYRERMAHFSAAGGNGGGQEPIATKPVIAEVDSAWLRDVEVVFSKILSDRHFNLEWVAAELNLSHRQFSRRLQQLTGLTPHHYLQEMRLQTARDCLLHGKYATVKETAFAVGYRDTPHFSTLFQERFGATPSAYQR